MRRIVQWALAALVPASAIRLFHLTWLLVALTIVAVVAVLIISASRRRTTRPSPDTTS